MGKNDNPGRVHALWSSSVARRNWLWACLALVIGTAPFVITVASAERGEPLAAAASITWLHFALLLFGIAAAFMFRWRLLDEPTSGWIASTVLLIGITLLPFALAAAASLEVQSPPNGHAEVFTAILVLFFMRAASSEIDPTGWRHPLLLGAGAGVVLTALPTTGVPDELPWLVPTLLTLIGLLIVVAILRAGSLPSWTLRMLSLVFALGMLWHHLIPFELLDADTARVLTLAFSAVASVMLISTTVVVLRQAIALHDRRLVSLSDRATLAERHHGHDEELLHELRSTVAGIASASRLLETGRAALPGERTAGLHRMLSAEVSRLERMLQPPTPESVEQLDLDALIEPLVIGLESQGAEIEHRPSGLSVHGYANGITEVVAALLSNAKRHAPAARVVVSSELSGASVVIRIADNGPGVPAEVRTALFQRDVKGPDSPGQGLGLYIAQRIIRDQGGELCLEDSHNGAVFSLRLPQMSRP